MNSFELTDLPLEAAEQQAVAAHAQGQWTLVGGLIANDRGQLFSQRRAMTRKFGPGWWDNVGGHLEGEETLQEALKREVWEETGWRLRDILRVVATRNWSDDRGLSKEFMVIATVDGDLANPKLEADKVDMTLWVDHTNLDVMNANRSDANVSQSKIYAHALELLNVYLPR